MFVASLAVTILVTVLFMLALRPVAISLNLVDSPGGRKEHVGDVPIIGGVSMFVGMSVGLLVIPGLEFEYLYLMAAGSLLVFVGLIDDRYGIPASVRLIGQLSAVLIVVYGGKLVMLDIGDPLFIGTIRLGPFSLIVTALIFMTVINAFNLIDGLDGLAGSMAVIAVLAIAATSDAGSSTFSVACICACAVVSYLIFNFPIGGKRTYRAFMGDSGSTFLGLVIVWLTVSVSQGAEREISPVTGLWFAALPLFDLLTCFVRRIARGESPFTSGRDHFHPDRVRAPPDILHLGLERDFRMFQDWAQAKDIRGCPDPVRVKMILGSLVQGRVTLNPLCRNRYPGKTATLRVSRHKKIEVAGLISSHTW